MNRPDQRKLVIFLCVALGGGFLFLGYNLFWEPLQDYDQQIAQLETANAQKAQRIQQIVRDQVKLRQWRVLSLPGVENLPKAKGPTNPTADRENAIFLAHDQYLTYLRGLLRKHRLTADDIPRRRTPDTKNVPEVRPGVPVYTPLQYSVDARGRLENVVKMLEEFQETPLLQRIRGVTIKRPTGPGVKTFGDTLTVSLVVEALIVNGSQKRGERLVAAGQELRTLEAAVIALRRRPLGAGAVAWGLIPWHKVYAAAVSSKRNYADIARKDIFTGIPPELTAAEREALEEERRLAREPRPTPDLVSTIYLTDATIYKGKVATLYDRATERAIRLRALPGWNTIPLLRTSEGGAVVRGEVLRITTRGITFRVEMMARSPDEEPAKLRYKAKDVIYSLYKPDAEALVKANVIKTSEINRTFKVPLETWQGMVRDKVVSARGPTFAFRHDIVRGRVLKRDDDFVLIRLDERYCSFRLDPDDDPVRPHYGYCFLPIGERVAAGLETPLQDSEVRELQETVAQAP